jgi:serine/threonine-protein kinase RsbT
MEVLKSEALSVRTSEDLVTVRTSVRKMAAELRFGIVDQTKIVTAASEIARNTTDYGRGGNLRETDSRVGMAWDSGSAERVV